MKKNLLFLIVGVILLSLDQVIKQLIRHYDVNLVIINKILSIHFVENRGISFGLLSSKPLLIIFMTAVISLIVGYLFVKSNSSLEKICWLLILIGAIGNIIDRLVFGYVIDYLDVNLFVCNLADIYIFIGALMLVFCYWKQRGV